MARPFSAPGFVICRGANPQDSLVSGIETESAKKWQKTEYPY